MSLNEFDLFNDNTGSSLDFNSDDLGFEAFAVNPEGAWTELQAVESYLDNCEQASLGLESLYGMITGTLNRGMSDGMSEGEAAFAYAAIEGNLSKVTADPSAVLRSKRVPSVESYDSTASRRLNTLALESSVKEILANIWKSVRELAYKFIDMVSKFFVEHIGGAKRLQNAAEKLKKKASDTSASGFKENKLSVSGSLYTNMMVDGAEPSASKIVEGLSGWGKELQALTGDKLEEKAMYKQIDLLNDKSVSKMEDLKKLEDELTKSGRMSAKAVIDASKSKYTSFTESKRFKESKTETFLKSKPLMGNKIMVVTVKHSENDILKGVSYQMVWPTADYKTPDNKQLASMNSSEIEKVAEAVEELCKDIIKYQVDLPKRRALVDKAKSMGDRLVKEIDSLESKDYKAGESISFYAAEANDEITTTKEQAKNAKSAMKSFINQFATNAKGLYEPGLSYQKQAFDSAKASFAWAVKCYGNLKKD